MSKEQPIETIKRLAHYHLALAYELCAYVHIAGVGHNPQIKEQLERIDKSGKEFEAYNASGKRPDWMDAAPPTSQPQSPTNFPNADTPPPSNP